MTELDAIRNTPIIQLTLASIDKLPDEDRASVFGLLFDMARDGDLTMMAVNPPGTTYEVCVNRERGWALRPICCCQNQPRFIEAYFEHNGPGQCTQTEKT